MDGKEGTDQNLREGRRGKRKESEGESNGCL